jgi:gluconolactonase
VNLEARDARFGALFDADAMMQTLSTGHLFTEGPLWDAKANRLLFSDIPGDRIHAWSEAAGTSVFRAPSHKSNGLAWDRQGRLLACEHATSRLTRTESDGRITVLASTWRGHELNSPNDVVVGRDGSIWFSDPTYGRMPHYGLERPTVLGHRGVYRLAPDGTTLSLVADDFRQPNGLCFSLDERRLFVNDTERGHVRVFDVAADGSAAGGAVWAELGGEGPGAPDGMKIDSAGNLWCCGPGGLHVYDADARCLGVLRTPAVAANFTWGDADRRSLYITASDTVLRVRVRVPGCPGPDA